MGKLMKKNLIAVGIILTIAFVAGTYLITRGPTEGQPVSTQLMVTTSTSTVRDRLDPVTLTVVLTSNGAPVEGKVINWSVTPGIGVGIPPSTTDSSGQASVFFPMLPPPVSSLAFSQLPITLTFTASFAGDNQYQENAGTVLIIVEPQT
jgi:hypothetical protein